MIAKARDIMSTKLHTLRSDMSLAEAMALFKKAGREGGTKVFGMPVINDKNELAGLLSMFDILLYIRPNRCLNWQEMDDAEVNKLLHETCDGLKTTMVRDIMTTDVITVTPETHIIKILDTMIRRYIRRLPVVENKKIVGMVYISAVFEHFCDQASL